MQHLRRIAGADNGRQAELAADDGGVRRAPAVIGHDRRRPPHDRHPVRVGGARDQDRAVDEAVDVARAFDQADAAGRDRLADAQPGHQRAALRLHAIGFERGGFPARLHRFRTGLHDEHFAALAVLGPLHVHRAAIVALDGAGPPRQSQNFAVVEHERAALDLGRRHVARRAVALACIDHFPLLAADRLFNDRGERGVGEERLEDLILVGIDGALHDVFAEPPGGVDDHDLVEARLGVDREHDAGAGEIRAHHVLDADRQRDFLVIEALGLPIGDGAVGEQRSVAALAGVEQRGRAANIQERFLLAGKARVGQILGGGARSHRDIGVGLAGAAAQLAIRRRDRLGEIRRPCRLHEGPADRRSRFGQWHRAVRNAGELAAHDLAQGVRVDEAPIRIGRGGKAGRHPHALRREMAHHLAERGVLAADERHVGASELFEPNNERRRGSRVGCGLGLLLEYHPILD